MTKVVTLGVHAIRTHVMAPDAWSTIAAELGKAFALVTSRLESIGIDRSITYIVFLNAITARIISITFSIKFDY